MGYIVDSHDRVFLPFDTAADQDLGTATSGQSPRWWVDSGLGVGSTHAKDGNALQLNFNAMFMNGSVALGGQDFTIDMWLYVDSSTGSYGRFLEFNAGSNANRFELARSGSSNQLYFYVAQANVSFNPQVDVVGKLVHWAFVYEHSLSKGTVYINGHAEAMQTLTLSRQTFGTLSIGYSYNDNARRSKGAVDCFRITDGLARWTSDFEPPSIYQADDAVLAVDTLRRTVVETEVYADTLRNVLAAGQVVINVDTLRRTVIETEANADTLRRVTMPAAVLVDTCRRVAVDAEVYADTLRRVLAAVEVDVSADTYRRVVRGDSVQADTYRRVQTTTALAADTARKVPHKVSVTEGDVRSLEISMTPQQVTDQVTLTLANADYGLMEYVAGEYLDYDCRLCVESMSKTGILQECRLTTSLDELLYREVNYKVIYPPLQNKEDEKDMAPASWHLEAIVDALGLRLDANFDDFISTMDCEQYDVPYRDLITNLFGWSSRVPQRLVNAFIRGDTLHVVQRGREPNTVNLDNLQRTMPTVNKELVRVAYGGALTQTKVERTPGVWWTRQVQPLQDTEDTTYSYIAGLLRHKWTREEDGTRTETDYEYDSSFANNKRFLSRETERKYMRDRFDREYLAETRVTEHVPLRNGQMETRVYVDGVLEASGVSKGTSNDIPSEYILKWETVTLVEPEDNERVIPGRALIDTTFPINDRTTLIDVTNAIKWLNRKTKETITMDIYDYNHVIDYNDKIVLDGVEYHLESNVVRKDSRVNNRQSISIVRWY